MKKTKNKKKITALFAASAVTLAALAGCSSGGSTNSSGSSSSKALDAQLAYAKAKVSDYSSSEVLLSAKFADKSFNKAYMASYIVNEKTPAEDYETIAKNLEVDSFYVTDGEGAIVASYPDDIKGKAIKDVKEIAYFNRIVKGVLLKAMTEPEAVEGSSEYKLYSGVARPGGGVVAVGYKTDGYNTVIGADLADKSGVNTVVLSGNTIISSTLEKAEKGAALDSLGVKDEDIKKGEFDMTVDGTKYNCKSETVDDYTVICAVPK